MYKSLDHDLLIMHLPAGTVPLLCRRGLAMNHGLSAATSAGALSISFQGPKTVYMIGDSHLQES
jgi:hypothetical protein